MLSIQQCVSLIQSGKALEAIDAFKARINANAKDVDAQQLIGVCYIMVGDYKLAEKHLLKALKLHPGHPDAQYNLARLYTEQDKYSKAKIALLNVLKQRPDWLEARFALGLAALGLKDIGLAEQSFKQVLAEQPNNWEAWFNLAKMKNDAGNKQVAREYYLKAIEQKSDYQEALISLARVLNDLSEIQAGIDLLESHRTDDSSSEYDVQLASSYRLIGNKEKAKAYALSAIDKDPKKGLAYKSYYDSIAVASVSDLTMLEQAIEQDQVADSDLQAMHFSLSKGLEACGEYERAIESLDYANYLNRKGFNYSTQESVQLFNMLKTAYSKANVDKMLGHVDIDCNNIFILGMPRSGTSLVEQIITSHSDVFGAGELPNMRKSWNRAGANSEAKFHSQLVKKDQVYWHKVGEEYLSSVADLKGGEAWLTDKMPHNFLMIGLIATVLPNAKIIHCKRHPVANCLSIYKEHFSGSHYYAYNQKELAEYHNLYEDLMDHWRQVLPGRFYEIKYEDLTSNQEAETRKLLEYIGLPWEDACLDFHKNKRAVKTASAYQVRQSMHTKSVDLWKRYGDGLKPLIDNLYIPQEYRD